MGAEESQMRINQKVKTSDITLSADLIKLINECFEIIDIDGNGSLSKYEIETKFHRVSNQEEMDRVLSFFRQMDINHDLEVSRDEFIDFWKKYKGSSQADDSAVNFQIQLLLQKIVDAEDPVV